VGALLALAASLVNLDEATAKTDHLSPYTYQQTFGSTLRLLKVDLAMKVTDKDADWGYLLFEYRSLENGKRKSRGSFEFVKSNRGVRVSLQLPAVPSYHERVIIDKLVRKLAAEHGTPPKKKKPPKRKKKRGRDDESKDKDDQDKSKTPSKKPSK